jgi:hypothetical protein
VSEPTERLQQLLSRVQQNRALPRDGARTAAPVPAPAPAAAPKTASVAANVPARAASRAPIAEERVSLPEHRSRGPAVEAARAAGRDRLSTPLEMAVEEQISRAPSEPPTGQFTGSRAAQPVAPAARSLAAKPQAARPRTDDDADFVIEAEPVREGTRAIAQTVSKYAPELDVTFGALLRRSLSLRPR